ncbi:hypothetical protein [Amycolatopsis sp. cmx-4-68]|uniref:hypothetical protein n=1 Tax=Amycolatopsis sp. cmx-4-68 TaxID=2790938 RepID=UPI0039792DFF
MPDKYGTQERATLFVLMLEGEEIANPDLKKVHGVDLGPAGRAKLNKAGLLESRMEGRRYVHKITDAGRAWCESELTRVETPSRSSALARSVFEIVRRVAGALQERGIRIFDLFSPADLETLIRAAYSELSDEPQDWVRLAKLRPKLNGAEKDEVDKVLLTMTRTGLVHLAQSANRKALTDADHAAAIRIGSEDKHLVAIEEA